MVGGKSCLAPREIDELSSAYTSSTKVVLDEMAMSNSKRRDNRVIEWKGILERKFKNELAGCRAFYHVSRGSVVWTKVRS